MNVKPITSDDDHKAALVQIEALWGARSGTPDGDHLDVLIALIEAYESRRWSFVRIGDPVDIIRSHMDANGYGRADLTRLFGSNSRVTEILNRKRPLTLAMIQKLNRDWGIPADLLVQPYEIAVA